METQLKNDGEYQNFSEFGGYHLMTKLFDPNNNDIKDLCYRILDFCLNELTVERMDNKRVFVCVYEDIDTYNHAFKGDSKIGRYLFSISRVEAKHRLEELQKYMDSWKYPITITDINIEHLWEEDEDKDTELISFRIYDKSTPKIYQKFEQLWSRFSSTRIYTNISKVFERYGLKRKSWEYFE